MSPIDIRVERNTLVDMHNDLEHPYKDEILTVEKILGPEADYEAIIVDLKKLCEKHKDIIFAEYEDEGIHLTNGFRAKKSDFRPVDPGTYKEAFGGWHDVLKKRGVQGWKINGLARLLYCKGEKELAQHIDFGHGLEVQHNPEGRIECPMEPRAN